MVSSLHLSDRLVFHGQLQILRPLSHKASSSSEAHTCHREFLPRHNALQTSFNGLSLHQATPLQRPANRGVHGIKSNNRRWRRHGVEPRCAVAAERANHVNFSSELMTDIPLRELFQVPFEDYMSDKERLVEAFFPDRQRCERLNDEVWRVQLLPINFFFLTVRPIIDMRIWTPEPSQAPLRIVGKPSGLLCLQAVRWDLQGIPVKPENFILGVNGALYVERPPSGPRLRGVMGLSVSIAVPDSLMFVPRGSIESVGNSLLRQLTASMKEKVNNKVLADYALYARKQAGRRRQV
eukprot:jgi/Mesen1/712/ME000109S_10934